MSSDAVGLLAASLFLLIAVVGGGFTIKELSIPTVPIWARFIAAMLGVLFAVPFVLNLTGSESDVDRASVGAPAGGQGPAAGAAAGGQVTIYADDQPETSPQSIRLLEVQATSDRREPTVSDRVTVTFSIENVAEVPFELGSTFVGARAPGDVWRDFGHGNVSQVLEPGEKLTVRSSIIVDAAGTWKFWPCFDFEHDGVDDYCPDEWKGFEVAVQR